jgi:hypothetical protein
LKIDIYINLKVKMEAYKAAFKDLIEKITRHAESIEEHNMILKQALHDLLNEDDVKELPAYTLLKMTYSPYLTDVSVASASTSKAKTSSSSTSTSTSTLGSGSVFTDPLHAPPSARRIGGGTKPLANVKVKVEVNPRRPIVGIPLEHQTQTHIHTHVEADTDTNHYSDQMPNMDFCLLGAAPAKSKVKVKVKEEEVEHVTKPDTIKLVPKEGETVYKVEIQGKHYLRYNDNLYNIETKHREGAISDFKLGQASPAVELETISDYPGYYVSDGTDNVYILVNGEIAQAVGTYTDGELALWS